MIPTLLHALVLFQVTKRFSRIHGDDDDNDDNDEGAVSCEVV